MRLDIHVGRRVDKLVRGQDKPTLAPILALVPEFHEVAVQYLERDRQPDILQM